MDFESRSFSIFVAAWKVFPLSWEIVSARKSVIAIGIGPNLLNLTDTNLAGEKQYGGRAAAVVSDFRAAFCVNIGPDRDFGVRPNPSSVSSFFPKFSFFVLLISVNLIVGSFEISWKVLGF